MSLKNLITLFTLITMLSTAHADGVSWSNHGRHGNSAEAKKNCLTEGNYITARIGDTKICRKRVELFIDDTRMSDVIKVKLFEQAEKNWDKYLKLRQEWIDQQFTSGLRQWVYFMMIQVEAKSDEKGGKWAFNTKESDFDKKVRDFENTQLKEDLDKGLGIRKAWENAGKKLKDSGYPHKASDSNTDVWFRWFNQHKRRMKEQERVTGIQRYEYYRSTRHNPELYFSPAEMFRLSKNAVDGIKANIEGKELTQAEVAKKLDENPSWRAMIKKIDYIALSAASLGSIKEMNEEKFQAYKKRIKDELIPLMGNDRLENLIKYEGMAVKMAEKYNDVAKLEEKSKFYRERFMSPEGTDVDLMKARIYALAAIQVRDKPNRQESVSRMQTLFADAMNYLKVELVKDEFYTNETAMKMVFHHLVDYSLKTYLNEKIKEDSEYTRSLLEMAVWTIKFEAKKMALLDKVEIKVTYNDMKTFEGQEHMQKFMKSLEIKNGMDRFKTRELRRKYEFQLEMVLDGFERIYGRYAYDFLFQ